MWRFGEGDEEVLSKVLPVDEEAVERKMPWVLFVLDVNTLNFCAFGSCEARNVMVGDEEMKEDGEYRNLLVAVPNTLKGENVSGRLEQLTGS